jgi:hypothetical protein
MSENVRAQALKLSIEKERELLEPLVEEARQLEKQQDELRVKFRNVMDLCGQLRNRISSLEWERTSLGRKLREDLVDEEEDDDE